MGRAARAKYESYYTASRNHDLLMQIYSDAIEQRKRDRGARSLTAGGTLLG
jgi:hypothetical protein